MSAFVTTYLLEVSAVFSPLLVELSRTLEQFILNERLIKDVLTRSPDAGETHLFAAVDVFIQGMHAASKTDACVGRSTDAHIRYKLSC